MHLIKFSNAQRFFGFASERFEVLLTSSLFLILFSTCGPADPPPPDVSGISSDVTVLRFDRALAAADTADFAGSLAELRNDFGDFPDIYFTKLVPVLRRDLDATERGQVFRAFREYPLTRTVDSVVAAEIDDDLIENVERDFEEALRYYQYYLPDAAVPDTLVLFTSNFELAAFLYGQGQIAAGLDYFLGPDFDYAAVNPEEPVFSAYLTRTYTTEHLTGKLLRVLLDDLLPAPRSGRLLDYLVHEGKKWYLLDKLQPHTDDHIVYEIAPEQMEWLRENETQIYTFLQGEELLYSPDPSKVRRFTQPAPTSLGMPPESPGGAANYLGRQIFASFLRNNPEVELREALAIEDGQEILSRARYKPR